MRVIIPLPESRVADFAAYFVRYSSEGDGAFPPGEDFRHTPESPTYLLLDGDDSVAGAVSLVNNEGYRGIGKSRVRMLHVRDNALDDYRRLLQTVRPHLAGLESLFIFLPESNRERSETIEALGFTVERVAYVLSRAVEGTRPPVFPEGYQLRPIAAGEEQAWCDVINQSFVNEASHFPKSPEFVSELQREPGYVDGGMSLLWRGDTPVGAVMTVEEEEEGERIAWIATIGVVPEAQGNGLGRELLLAGVEFGRTLGVERALLSVQGHNDGALILYRGTGFEVVDTMVCYSIPVASLTR